MNKDELNKKRDELAKEYSRRINGDPLEFNHHFELGFDAAVEDMSIHKAHADIFQIENRHLLSKIEQLESKLRIAVDALTDISNGSLYLYVEGKPHGRTPKKEAKKALAAVNGAEDNK